MVTFKPNRMINQKQNHIEEDTNHMIIKYRVIEVLKMKINLNNFEKYHINKKMMS